MKIKELIEKRNNLLTRMKEILNNASTETRAMTDEENTEYQNAKNEVERLRLTIVEMQDTERRGASSEETNDNGQAGGQTDEQRAEAETHEFANYIRGVANRLETRAGEQNVSMSNNTAVIPVSIANRIITKIQDICPIFKGATQYHVKGKLRVPKWTDANSTHNITCGYATEFTDLTADAGKFDSVDLEGYLMGALTLIGRSVVNNADIDVVNFVIGQMAEVAARKIEKECLVGTGSSAMTGATSTSTGITAAAAAAVTADELITLQAKIKQGYQKNACWTMHSDTFTEIKKLKDTTNRYLLQEDFSSDLPFRLLGKPVNLSDNMPAMAAGAKPILYGDYSGLSVNIREEPSVEVLREKYATQHALGVVMWFEMDSKVTDEQKLAVLTMKAS